EGLVYGAKCGRGAAEAAAGRPDTFVVPPLEHRRPADRAEPLDVADITNSLRSLMVRRMGIVRDRAGLRGAERQGAVWGRHLPPRVCAAGGGSEWQTGVAAPGLMLGWAREREEPRGVPSRSASPRRDDEHWLRHVVCPAGLP